MDIHEYQAKESTLEFRRRGTHLARWRTVPNKRPIAPANWGGKIGSSRPKSIRAAAARRAE